MKLTSSDITHLKAALSAARSVEINLVVLADGKIMGANDKYDAAIVSDLKLSIPGDIKIGIGAGRVDELVKRLALFGDDVEADLKVSDKGEVSLLTFGSGRSKVQFRCTSMALLEKKYPKANADEPGAVISLSKDEVAQLVKAARGLSSEAVVIKVASSGEVMAQCSDSNNDVFSMVLNKQASFVGEPQTGVASYRAALLTSFLDAGTKGNEEMDIVIGQGGSLTGLVKQHALFIMQRSDGDE